MQRKEYEDTCRTRLEEMEREVERLRAHIKEIEAEHGEDTEHHRHFQQIHGMNEDAKRTYQDLQKADDKTYDNHKSKLEQYWSSLGREIKAYDQKLKV